MGRYLNNSRGRISDWIIVIAIIAILAHNFSYVTTQASYDVIVTDKAIKRIDGRDVYLIYTELISTGEAGEVRVFQITDSFTRMRFDSADMYASIKVGRPYHFEVFGKRTEILSEYENIIYAELIPSDIAIKGYRRNSGDIAIKGYRRN